MSDSILNPFTPDEQTGAPIGLDDLVVSTPLSASAPPPAAVRNRSAQTALLSSDPKEAMTNYNTMQMESGQGQDTTYQSLTKNIDETTNTQDLNSLGKIFSDPNMSLEQKQAAADGFTKALFLKDKGTTIHTNLLTAPVKEETPDGEAARISTAGAIREMYEARSAVQGLWNKHIMESRDKSVGGAMADFAQSVIPLSDSIVTNQINQALEAETKGTPYAWDASKTGTFFQPGFTKADIAKRLAALPPDQQVPFAKAIIKVVSNNSNILFGNDNQFQQFQIGDSIFEKGGYSNTQEFLDNVFPLLDIIGMGGAAKGITSLAKGSTAAKAAERVEPSFAYTGKAASRSEGATAGGEGLNIPPNEKAYRPGSRPQDVEDVPYVENVTDVPFTETPRSTPQGMGPNRQIDSGIPKLAQEPTSLNNRRGLIGNGEQPPILENPVKRLTGPESVTDQEKRVVRNLAVRTEHPATPGEIANQSNSTVSRNMYDIATSSVDDQAAEALYGVDRVQAAVNGSVPQITLEGAGTTTKTADIGQAERLANAPDQAIVNVLHDSGSSGFTPTEIAAARANVANDFAKAEGMTMNEAMSSFQQDGSRIMVNAVYDAGGESFSSAQAAMEQAKFALRNYGVRDDEIKILRKEGLDHVPYEGDLSKLPEGDYKIQVQVPYEFTAKDADALEHFDVKYNYFDRFRVTQSNQGGSLTRYAVDAASMFRPELTQAAEVASDLGVKFEKRLLKKAQEYTDDYSKLPKDRQVKLDDYLREANYNGIDFDQTDLISRGFNAQEIGAVRKWRDFWDTHYYLENFDLVRTLTRQGFQKLESPNATLFAKPVSKNGNLGRLYDPSSNSVRQLTAGELDQLYNSGGTLARLRRPAQINGETVEHIISRNTPTEYLRGMRDTDQVLNYRKGYYQLSYKNPVFVDSIQRDANGNVIAGSRRTLAVAGDTREAQRFAARQQALTGEEHVVRYDRNAIRNESDEAWDLNAAGGRIAQRQRGKLLQDAGGLNRLGDGSFIYSPAESAVKAAKSVAGRTIMRPVIETAKERFMQQYQQFLPRVNGQIRYPNSLDELVDSVAARSTGSDIADARSTWSYIHFLEDGYINSADSFAKAMMHELANTIGEKGYPMLERGVRAASEYSIPRMAKGFASNAYIASNVARQLVLQPAQAIRMMAYNPTGILSGNVTGLFNSYIWQVMNKAAKLTPEQIRFRDFIRTSGLLDAVDHHNLVRGSLMQLADQGPKSTKWLRAIPQVLRRVGFDLGESANMLGHAAAVFDRYERLGRNLANKDVAQAAHGEIRALTGSMNAAGDMPYNRTTPAMIFQFMQSPHKILLQASNRRLDPWTRVKLIVGDMMLWGTPLAMIGSMIGKDVMPENQEARQMLNDGVLASMYNQLAEDAFDSAPIDLKSLDPRGLDGIQKMAIAWMSGGPLAAIQNSPAGSLFLKDNGRVQTAMRSIGRYFNAIPEYDDNDPQTFVATLNDIAKISSGYSNGYKAYLMLQTQKRLDAYGGLIDAKTTNPEIIAQIFGFGAKSQSEVFDISKKWQDDVKSQKEDALKAYKQIKQYYADRLTQGETDVKFLTAVTGAVLNQFADKPEAMAVIQKQMQRDFSSVDNTGLLNLMIQRSGWKDSATVKDDLKQLLDAGSIKQQDYEQAVQILNDTDNARNELKNTVKKEK